ncbi:hypothetical protein OROMI_009419 [Orobanche minor]
MDADVLANARESSSRDEAEKVAFEKRKREVAEISEEVTKKLKAEIQSPDFIQMLANAIVSLLPGIASTGAGVRELQAGEKERGLFLEKSAGAGNEQAQIDGRTSRENEASTDNEAVTSSHIQKGLLVEQPLFSQLPNTQELAAEFAWNYDIHQNVFGGEEECLPFAVGKDYFEYIKDVTKELEHMHMEPYVAILAKDPHIAQVHGAQKRFVAMGVQFQKAVEDVWKAMHGEKPEGWVPDHKTEEVILVEHMEHLEQFAEGLLPEWGGLKKWIEVEKLVLIKWPLYFPLNSANKLHQRDNVSCGPLALKSMENRLADIPDKMMYKKNLPAWRAHIAETIYNYSTHERTIAD